MVKLFKNDSNINHFLIYQDAQILMHFLDLLSKNTMIHNKNPFVTGDNYKGFSGIRVAGVKELLFLMLKILDYYINNSDIEQLRFEMFV